MRFSKAVTIKLVAGAVSVATLVGLAGCGSSQGSSNQGGGADSKQTITIGTFNNEGFDAPKPNMPGANLYNKYMKLHPNITIKATNAATSDDAKSAFNTAIGTGTGAYDVQTVDVDWMPSIIDNESKVVDLKDVLQGNTYLDWKTKIATAPDGAVLGAGLDAEPEAICYRSDLLKAAGMPSDRDAFAAAFEKLGGDWTAYFKMGQEYVQKTGKPWFDSAAALDQSVVNQIKYSYVNKDGSIIAATNPTIKLMYDRILKYAVDEKESAGDPQWSNTFNQNFNTSGKQSFATTMCPAWFINNIQSNAGPSFKGWDIANAFPKPDADENTGNPKVGAGTWGGSYLVIPKQGDNASDTPHLRAVEAFVKWMTAPAQQTAVFTAANEYPSSPTSQADPAVSGKKSAFLNNAPVGQIFKDRSQGAPVPFKGSAYFTIQSAMANALNRVDAGVDANGKPIQRVSADASWKQFLSDVASAGN